MEENFRQGLKEIEENVNKSFTNVKYDIQTINSWIFDLYRNHSIFPQKFDEASQKIVTSLETELNKIKDLFEDFTEISTQQLKRIENLESFYDEMTSKMRNLEFAANRVENVIDSIDTGKLDRILVVENHLEKILDRLNGPKTEAKKITFYSSGTKGSKYHTRDCLAYRRLKSPKSYSTLDDARKAGLKVCKLCMPTEK